MRIEVRDPNADGVRQEHGKDIFPFQLVPPPDEAWKRTFATVNDNNVEYALYVEIHGDVLELALTRTTSDVAFSTFRRKVQDLVAHTNRIVEAQERLNKDRENAERARVQRILNRDQADE